MRKLSTYALAVALLLGTSTLAGAAPLNWAGSVTVEAGDIAPVVVTGGGVATVNNSAGGLPAHLNTLRLKGSRGNIAGTETVLITDPETVGNGIAGIIIEAQAGTGTFAPISGGVASTSVLTSNRLPIRGVAKICLISTTCTAFLPLLLTEATTGSGVVGVGVGGVLTAGGTGVIRISLEAAPWTVKVASVIDHVENTAQTQTSFITLTRQGFAHGPASNPTSTAQPSGVVQLVTPAQVRTNLALGTSAKLGVLVSLAVHFIPEPGILLLLCSGVAGLAVIGRSKMRK